MSSKTSFKMLPTLIVLAVLLGAWYVIFPGKNGRSVDGKDRQALTLTIMFEPARRSEPIKAFFTVRGTDTVEKDIFTSPWSRVIIVDRGTLVVLGARQTQPGILHCKIQEGSGMPVADSNFDGFTTLRDYVKCSTGSV